jgi:hypothetical protein
MLFDLLSNENLELNKENLNKDKYKNQKPNKIKLFTTNPNVFIPRTTNKHYGSYLSKSKIN